MTKKNNSNLSSRNNIRNPCDLANLDSWILAEVRHLPDYVRDVISHVIVNLDSLVKFPKRAELLWRGCDRTEKYHKYPNELKVAAKSRNVDLNDGRANGPAIGAFLVAGGERPDRYGSHNQWTIHHIYSSKFPYPNKKSSLHAIKDGTHFTQSAGLVAAHPIADAMCDEFPEFAWFLRAHAFKRFGYDPDQVFSTLIDEFGFSPGHSTTIHYCKLYSVADSA